MHTERERGFCVHCFGVAAPALVAGNRIGALVTKFHVVDLCLSGIAAQDSMKRVCHKNCVYFLEFLGGRVGLEE